mgnify:CR=1 FL=1
MIVVLKSETCRRDCAVLKQYCRYSYRFLYKILASAVCFLTNSVLAWVLPIPVMLELMPQAQLQPLILLCNAWIVV